MDRMRRVLHSEFKLENISQILFPRQPIPPILQKNLEHTSPENAFFTSNGY